MYPSLSGNAPHLLSTSLSDTTWPTHLIACGSAFARPESACPCTSALLSAPSVRYTGHGRFLRRVPLTLYTLLMFCSVEIRKAHNMLSWQCETWRDAFLCIWVCPQQNVYVGRHVPFVSQLSETGGNSEYVHYHITVSWFVDVGGSLNIYRVFHDFRA